MKWERWLVGGGLGETERDRVVHSLPGHGDDLGFYSNGKPLKGLLWERNTVRFTTRKKSLWLLGTEWLRESGRIMSRLRRCFRRGMTMACSKVLILDLTNTRFPFLLPDCNAISVTPYLSPRQLAFNFTQNRCEYFLLKKWVLWKLKLKNTGEN